MEHKLNTGPITLQGMGLNPLNSASQSEPESLILTSDDAQFVDQFVNDLLTRYDEWKAAILLEDVRKTFYTRMQYMITDSTEIVQIHQTTPPGAAKL